MSCSELSFEVVVVGAGPAGLAAAWAASLSGRPVALLDDNPGLGGQIWRAATDSQDWVSRVRNASNIRYFAGTSVAGMYGEGVLMAEQHSSTSLRISFGRLILATGARERFLPFPGWTLPGSLGAGALQALLKGGLDIRSRRVIVAGTGPLLLAVASLVRTHGAQVVCIAEQAPASRIRAFAAGLPLSKLLSGVRLRYQLRSVPCRYGAWPIAANGSGRVESVVLHQEGREFELPCDFLACGFGLLGNTELAELLGCRLSDGFVIVDSRQETNVRNVYSAGEINGIGGVEIALLEGQIAGFAATSSTLAANAMAGRRDRAVRFRDDLARTYALRQELLHLAKDDTIVCRCEDIPLDQLRGYTNWKEAKLQSRCGMGPCQGRICGPATSLILGWKPDSIRPPVLPVRVGTLASD